ncbi:hypothetical protein SARC_08012 [Sphaeroforma arctica JP610]|uniref:Uncharacterized protein n=1 Tax=Sphaeroforma arctica JP610 TaxID=667725 RepID=A0A0L0FUK6_9EUKA|nr:hypothetical protein SARC_08012 [Sphaeroforma arctica JP610]KNC79593.1 hypothetical protein SARC_08012 [Sphaeroforma arctica JP610]|eukprot:XP_014153495.1 hypothetical protein SARC_08012 [Sphaeroforma arctica JP610]
MGGVGSPSPLRNKDRKPISPSKSQIVPKIGGSAGSETTMAKSRSVGGRDEGEKYNLDKYIHKDKQKQMDRKRASMLAFQFSRVDGYHSSTHDYSTDQLLSVQDRKRALEAKKEKGRQKQQMTINEQSTDSTEPHQGRGASERDTSTQLTRKVTNNTAKREVRDAIEADTLRRMKEYESNTQWRSERRREMRSTSMLTQAVRFTAQMLLGVGFVFGLVMMTLSMLAYIQEDYASHLKAPIYFSSTSSALKLDNAHVIEWDLHKNMTTWGADNGTDSGTGGVLGRLHDSLYSPSPDPPNTTTTHTLNPRSDPGVNLDTCPKDSNRGCVNPKWGKGQSPKWTPSAVPLYSVCGRHWHGLTVIDYGLLSQASYFLPEKQNEVVSAFFVDRPGIPQARIIHAEDTLEPICACDRQNMDDCECETAAQAKIWRAKFMEVYFDSLDLTVIAVQGTDPANIGDVVEDVRMWTETVVYQVWAHQCIYVYVYSYAYVGTRTGV